MRRRDSFAGIFSSHGSKNLTVEAEGLLTDNEDNNRVSPTNESYQIRPSCLIDNDDSSSSWFILADSDPEDINCDENCDESRNQNNNSAHRKLSDLFARVVKPKIQASRSRLRCVVKERDSKILGEVDQVSQVSLK